MVSSSTKTTGVSKQNSVKPLGSFCQNRASVKTKIALMTFYKIRYSELAEKIINLLEYLQVVSQAFLLFSDIEYDSNVSYRFITDLIVYFFKLINPSYLLTFSDNNHLISSILTVLVCLTILRIALTVYIFLVAFWDLKGNSILVTFWQWIFKLQGRVTYFLLSSFWVRAILSSSEDTFSLFGMGTFGSMSISCIMIVIEFAVSFVFGTQFCYVLPTKNFLSSKSQTVETVTLVQKFVMQVLQMCIGADFSSAAWATSIINLLFSSLNNYQYYRTLPLYKFGALMFQGDLMNVAVASNIACFFHTILWTASFEGADMNFIVVVWIFFSIMMVKIFREHLHRTLVSLLTKTNKAEGTPEMLIHKVVVSKELNKAEKLPGEQSETYDYSYLLLRTQLSNLKSIFDLKFKEDAEIYPPNMKRKKAYEAIYINYLEGLIARHPKNSLIKLFFARICARNPDLYIKTIKIAAQLRQKEWSKNYLTSAFLLHEIEKSIVADYENSTTELDLVAFVENNVAIEKLKTEMLKMIEQKIAVCNNVMEETCNIGTIFNNAQSIYDLKSEINKKIKTLSSTLPDNYVSPLLLFAEYQILANYSLYDYEKLGKLYLQRYFKYEKQFKDVNLTQDNLYHDQNVFLILSGQKISSGQILHCGSSIQNLCGGERGAYVDSHVSSLFTPILRAHYDDFFKQIFETGNRSLMNKINKAFIYHKNKHIVEVEFFLRVHPFVTKSLCLQMMIRPSAIQNEYLLLREDGTIEGGTQKISQALGLNSSANINIKLFSEELARMNIAFNIVHKSQTSEKEKLGKSTHENLLGLLLRNKFKTMETSSPASGLDQKEADEIYERFTSKGKKVEFKLYGQTQDRMIVKETGLTSTFYCKASIVSFSAGTFMKVIELHHTAIGEDILSSRKVDGLKASSRVFGSFRTGDGIEKRRFSSGTDKYFEVERVKCDDDASENIDCNERETNNMTLMSPRRAIETGTDRGLLSPKVAGTDRDLLSPKSIDNGSQMDFPLISATARNDNQFEFRKKKTESFENSVETGEMTNIRKNKNHQMDQKAAPRYLSSQQSSVKGDRSSYKSFKAAIKSRSYPRSFTILCVVFYAVIVGTFISQIVLKIVSDETMEDLVIKKNLLENAEVFSYKAQQIQINSQTGALQIQGALVVNGAVTGMVDVLKNLKDRVATLHEARLTMSSELASLDSKFQGFVTTADVQMTGTIYSSQDTSVVRNLTVFQAAEVMENAVQLILGLPNAVSTKGFHAFNFLGMNILDQFLTKCNEMTAYFASSVSEQKSFFLRIVRLCLVITPFTLLGVAIAFIFIVWSQYRIGRKYMLIFVKLRQNGVKDIQMRLVNFRKNLKSGDLMSSKNYMNYFGDLGTQMLDEKDQTYHKNSKNQVVIETDYRRKYYSHVIRVVAYLSTLIAIMIWNYVATTHSTNIIYNKQSQLEFANYISTRISVGYSAFCALYIKNNTLHVEGDTAYNVLVRAAKEVIEIQNEIPKRFLNVDETYDSPIKTYLYGKYLCEDMPAYPMYHCSSLMNRGLPVNMLPLVASYAALLSNKILDFDNADRSTIGKILAAAYKNIETFLPQYVVITNEAQKMATYIDASLADNITIANKKRTQILIVFTVLLLIVSVLIWVNILRRLREVDNDFKKVLQVFPSKLVLSSFLLKMFLKKTSQDHLIL